MQPFITLQSLNFEIILQKLINVYTLIRACRWEKSLWKNKRVYMFIRKGRVDKVEYLLQETIVKKLSRPIFKTLLSMNAL